MKRFLSTLIVTLLAFKSFAALEFDLRKGVDFTTTNFITASMLNQLIDAGTVSATNKGAVIAFSSVGSRWPDVTLNPRYTNFIWLDTITYPPTLRTYVPVGDALTNWVAGLIGPGSITATEIKDYTITMNKMATNSIGGYAISNNAVSGAIIADNGVLPGKIIAGGVIQGNIAFGAIVGGQITNKTITATNIADGTITELQIAPGTFSSASISNSSITTIKIAQTNITRDLIRDDAIGTLQITNGAVTTNKLAGDINSGLLHTNASYGLFKCWASVDSDGTMLKGLNVSTVIKLATGQYRVTFGSGFTPTGTNYAILLTSSTRAVDSAMTASYYSNTTAKVDIDIRAINGAGSGDSTDAPFSIGIMDQLP